MRVRDQIKKTNERARSPKGVLASRQERRRVAHHNRHSTDANCRPAPFRATPKHGPVGRRPSLLRRIVNFFHRRSG